ncbi:nuclear transport factor 2 family protein [Aliiroseovarius sp. KMU-50]|uniref:Nuclear transport factor 2 family protein n=1 Tax=Aliiroseovarius salicola TaxID=3009082 RepID=A0ABT4W2F0_9RHOB|nr:nuclear transport factor 2 family protein [Aliiroseovarius sp. KMU-50]MDA5094692.1 nuclear transport factor 2 family protein [Aliiroseovarius sp. KMU-50]
MSNLDILRNWYDRVWVDGDLESVDTFFTPDTEAQGMMEFAMGPDDFKAVAAAVHETIEVVKISFDRVVEADNWVWAQMSAHAQARLVDKDVVVAGQVMCRFDNGKIVEAYNQFDFLSFFEQLGLLPEHTLALCLAGETLG